MEPNFEPGRRGPGGPGGQGGPGGEHTKYLAEALGIPVDELKAAMETAMQAERAAMETAMKADQAQAVQDGRMPQEQVDLLEAGRKLQQYIMDKKLMEAAAASAVKDGVITQAQADALAKMPPRVPGGPGGPGGPGRGPQAGGQWGPRT